MPMLVRTELFSPEETVFISINCDDLTVALTLGCPDPSPGPGPGPGPNPGFGCGPNPGPYPGPDPGPGPNPQPPPSLELELILTSLGSAPAASDSHNDIMTFVFAVCGRSTL